MSVAVVSRIVVAAVLLAVAALGARAVSTSVAAGLAVGAVAALLALTAERLARRAPIERLLWGVVGGTIGLLAGTVAGRAAGGVLPWITPLADALGAMLGLYLGVAVGVSRGGELIGLNAWLFPPSAPARPMKLVDTSAIIDGRIADLAATGFVDGPLVVPQFVLRELQQIADSTDPRRRARGQRGFEVVQQLQRLPGALVEIADLDVPGVDAVDDKLLDLARTRGAKVITTDYTLNRRAEVSGVAVLNVNDLTNAVKSSVVAGERLRVHVMREGKEAGQGVGYLDDGTMVVVDQGKRWLGQTVDVAVTSVLQTPSGRIVFTRLRDEEPNRA